MPFGARNRVHCMHGSPLKAMQLLVTSTFLVLITVDPSTAQIWQSGIYKTIKQNPSINLGYWHYDVVLYSAGAKAMLDAMDGAGNAGCVPPLLPLPQHFN